MTKEEYLKTQADIILNEVTLAMTVGVMQKVATETALKRFNDLTAKEKKKALSGEAGKSSK